MKTKVNLIVKGKNPAFLMMWAAVAILFLFGLKYMHDRKNDLVVHIPQFGTANPSR